MVRINRSLTAALRPVINVERKLASAAKLHSLSDELWKMEARLCRSGRNPLNLLNTPHVSHPHYSLEETRLGVEYKLFPPQGRWNILTWFQACNLDGRPIKIEHIPEEQLSKNINIIV